MKDKHLVFAYLKAALVVALFSELYVTPIISDFRFSASIIVLNAILLLEKKYNPFYLSALSGLFVIVLRLFIFSLHSGTPILSAYMPSMAYYLIFGVLHYFIKDQSQEVRWRDALYFMGIDLFANIGEAFFRDKLTYDFFKWIFLVATIRALVAFVIFTVFTRRTLYILNEAHQNRYVQLNQLFSSIQSELFYLEKSSEAIEKIMTESYGLYTALNEEPTLSQVALDIAREVHEVKKDYQRVMMGFRHAFEGERSKAEIKLSEAIHIINNTHEKMIRQKNLESQVQFSSSFLEELVILEPYVFFAIVNNLAINAIEMVSLNTLKTQVAIKVSVACQCGMMQIEVADTCGGISDSVVPYVFNPGFTTKFGKEDMQPSNGMGLCHVKHMVERFSGKIELETSFGQGTTFKVAIPESKICRRLQDES